MVNIGDINDIRQEFNKFYDTMIAENAENEEIGLPEFKYRMRIIENSRVTLNEEFDFILMMMIRREIEKNDKGG